MNGLGAQAGPSSAYPVSYPFKSYAGNVSFGREVWGQRTFDLDKDGLANYGLYADWLHGIQLAGGNAAMQDMFQGAEAYLEMWERAVGVPVDELRSGADPLRARRFGTRLRLGETTTQALFSAGQPTTRPGRSFRYCVAGARLASRQRCLQQARASGADRQRYVAPSGPLHRRRVRAASWRSPARRPARRRVLEGLGCAPRELWAQSPLVCRPRCERGFKHEICGAIPSRSGDPM